MVLTSSTETWFLREGEAGWHVCTTADPTSYCGATRLRYNGDNVADALPFEAVPCAPCTAIKDQRDGITPAPPKIRKPRTPKSK